MRDRLRKIDAWMMAHEKEVLQVALFSADIMMFVAIKKIRKQNEIIRKQNQSLRVWNQFEDNIVDALSKGQTIALQIDPFNGQKFLSIQ